VDIAAFNLCQNIILKQRLLSTLNVHRRFELFSRQLRGDIDEIKLRRRLQGGLPDDQIARN
jgi:ATP-dependent Lon protease